MNVIEALSTRKSTRAFLDKPVAEETIIKILDAARHAPSGVNTQPWNVAVLSGEKKLELQNKMEQVFRSGKKGAMDYHYYPSEWKEPFKGRRKACGLQLYQTLEISRQDRQRQIDQWAANYRAFDAPAMLLFFMPAGLAQGSFLDYGMFLQSVMLAAVDLGLATCPQASLAEYPEIVKQALDYPEDSILICGMALGYEDTSAAVNTYRTPREAVDSFTRYYD